MNDQQRAAMQMALEAGGELPRGIYPGAVLFYPDKLEGFAALVAEAKDKEIAAKQAEIDRLMWEFCPQEMTPEQVANWEAHQQPWSDK